MTPNTIASHLVTDRIYRIADTARDDWNWCLTEFAFIQAEKRRERRRKAVWLGLGALGTILALGLA